VEAVGVEKSFHVGGARSEEGAASTVPALRGAGLQVAGGEFVAIVGRSGCGKSTFLNILGGLDRPSGGSVRVGGQDLATLSERDLTRYRRDGVGIVFQSFNLLPLLSVRENVVLPALMAGKNRRESLARAEELLERVGLEHRLHHESALLSGGEAQRVAVARALINGPALLLADEPTGNLDSQSAQDVLSALQAVARGEGRTVVMVTHSLEAARVADRVHEMRDGRFVS
jgi:ABC-type lipoprotein export system ATPase subunit